MPLKRTNLIFQLITDYNQTAQGFSSLKEALKSDNVDAVILATPTQMHAEQAIACMEAGKHVLVEIPMADNIEDSYKVVETQKKTGVVAMAGHTRRFNPSHQWIHNKIAAGELNIQQMDVQTLLLSSY
ncbi:Gfo/Idh/MocA family oxidoreductase [Vibrio chagasii]|nr:Gfo/Idh/MocA family oxidoreductase [Vibrio chagasii]